MKKYIIYIVMMLVLASLVLAEIDPLDYEELQLRTVLHGKVSINPTKTSYFVNEAVVDLQWVPDITYRQEVLHIETDPVATIDENVNFVWKNPTETELEFEVITGTKERNQFLEVYEKVDFPMQDVESDLFEYVKASNISDITPEIRDLASGLVADEDDLYHAVFNIAEWISENIEYDYDYLTALTSLTAETSQTASWVLENKIGVCDEISTLFISLCRSVGIPTRFVSGISYTNVGDAPETWGPHGWAEVYFPGTGWVPFDATYKEFGYLDATHIKLADSIDAQGASMHFSASGKNINIESKGITTETQIIGKGDFLKPLVTLEADIYRGNVGFGSCNMVTVTIKNNQRYYVPITLKVGKPEEIVIVGKEEQSLLLEPFEERKTYFIVKINHSLKDDYQYTFPLIIQDRRKGSVEVSFKSEQGFPTYDSAYFEMFLASEEEAKTKPYSKNVTLNCTPDKEKLYLEDTLNIRCTLYNGGNKILPYAATCLKEDCNTTRIPAYGNVTANFTRTFNTIGVKTISFSAGNLDFSKTTYVLVNVLDKPSLEIKNITYPPSVSFDEDALISFNVYRNSSYPPKNATVTIKHDLFVQEWDVKSVEKNNNFEIGFKGRHLKNKNNFFDIFVNYEDENGKKYSVSETIQVDVLTDNFLQKLLLIFNSWEAGIEQLFS